MNLQGKELKNDERTSITSGEGVSCLLLQNITTDDSGVYDVTVKNGGGADCHYASVSVEGKKVTAINQLVSSSVICERVFYFKYSEIGDFF